MHQTDHETLILDAAERLFYARGIQAVGMDELRTAAGVSLKRLYQSFPSKDELVAAYLDRRDERWLSSLRTFVGDGGVIELFAWLVQWFSTDDFRGCAFLNAYGELGGRVTLPVRRHKDRLHALLRELAVREGAPDPDLRADQLLVLVDGATVTAMLGRPNAAGAALRLALADVRG
ncbi:TetR/AcrR family transcriptional regulator [Actinocorallia populi]|uniref:TetR/AcrR family transcriptional regulator n=1 Tax=Actinocorallia populi TaxID=2079200 RepID=UPI000D097B14|nr:TetR/AcrR family transcriptional regulator [Actinocorallia populi]